MVIVMLCIKTQNDTDVFSKYLIHYPNSSYFPSYVFKAFQNETADVTLGIQRRFRHKKKRYQTTYVWSVLKYLPSTVTL